MTPQELITDDHDSTIDDTSSTSSDESFTSTEQFDHEPFANFQGKVHALCRKLWPLLREDSLKIPRMEGGSYNCVVGIQIKNLLSNICGRSRKQGQALEYVLRIPRADDAWVEHDIAMLLYLQTLDLPTPQIKTFDLSNDNAIHCPFTLQLRIPGQPAVDVYSDLSTAQRISLAKDMGTFLAALMRVTVPAPGNLDSSSIMNGTLKYSKVLEVQCPPRNCHRGIPSESMVHAQPCSVPDFISRQLIKQREYDLSYDRKYINPWSRFGEIITELNKKGLFSDVTYGLVHMDLETRNTHIDATSPTTARLAGVLDWDEAVFCPSFRACKPPSWLWDTEGYEEEEFDGSPAHATPTDPGLASIKQAFDDAVGEEYLKYAYDPEYRIARNIARFAITGIHSCEGYEVAEKIIKE